MRNPFSKVRKEQRGQAGIANYRGELLYAVTDGCWMTVSENLLEPQAVFLVAAINGHERMVDILKRAIGVWIPDNTKPPCEHRGCYNHVSHPCESCGRIQGKVPLYLEAQKLLADLEAK